jgi:excisionase family DNA binding protein
MSAAEPHRPDPTRRPSTAGERRLPPPSPEPGTRPPARRAPRTGASLPTLIDIPTAAEHLGTSPRHIRRLVAERRIPYLKLGHYVRFDPDELETWLDDHRVKTIGRTYRLP